jgi:hypothetical protein
VRVCHPFWENVNQIGTISEAIKACQMSQAQVQIYVCMEEGREWGERGRESRVLIPQRLRRFCTGAGLSEGPRRHSRPAERCHSHLTAELYTQPLSHIDNELNDSPALISYKPQPPQSRPCGAAERTAALLLPFMTAMWPAFATTLWPPFTGESQQHPPAAAV